jgi:hypothetical protein
MGDEQGENPLPSGWLHYSELTEVNASTAFSFFEISEELADLDPEIYALDIVHAVVRVLLFEMRREFVLAFLEIQNIGVLLNAEAKAERYVMPLDFRVHLQNLISQLIVRIGHKALL